MSNEEQRPADPIYQSSIRELKWIVVIFLINITWVIGYCSLFGYQTEDQQLTTILGLPSWVFWGVFVPWIVAAVVSSWFALTQMTDHPLEDAPPSDSASMSDSASEENPDG